MANGPQQAGNHEFAARPSEHRDGSQAHEPRGINPEPWIITLHNVTDRLGTWDAREIDLTQDFSAWGRLNQMQQGVIVRSLARFVHGEHQVDVNLDPLVECRIIQGRTEEARYIKRFQLEEAKHTEFFLRFFKEVVQQVSPGVDDTYSKPYRKIFNDILPRVLANLKDPDWRKELKALVTYMIVAEGILAETGYFGFEKVLEGKDGKPLLPGLMQGFQEIKRDEARHIAYGVNAIRRITGEHGTLAKVELLSQLAKLSPDILGCVGMVFKEFHPFPFESLDRPALRAFAWQKFKERVSACLRPGSEHVGAMVEE